MQPPHQDSRVNLVQLKADIVKRLGPERSKQYFYYLNRLLALKLTKVEFNKLCFRILGKENVALHNRLICSILRNACHAKSPPAVNDEEAPKSTLTKALNQPVFLNGNVLPLSPEKEAVAASSELIEQSKNDGEVSFHHPAKLSLIKTPPDGPVSVNSKVQNDLVAKGGKEYPLEVYSMLHLGFHSFLGRLYDIETLRERMQQIATTHGLEGVSVDSANLLNNGLDIYLKGLIRSCMEMVGHHYQIQSSCRPLEGMQEGRSCSPVSLLDFKVAMELNHSSLVKTGHCCWRRYLRIHLRNKTSIAKLVSPSCDVFSQFWFKGHDCSFGHISVVISIHVLVEPVCWPQGEALSLAR
ncbi:hypothetical protein CK203_084412 [Vitis vinifera]|uniref:Transcriptional adapter 1 n=1 Tax=Vitis vinifera TaxID=29760 RepID=A0A438EN08_VITVI|nr:hypothetical protein CK203_084412 [Vitis vinifera]